MKIPVAWIFWSIFISALGLQVSQCQNEINGCVKKSPINVLGINSDDTGIGKIHSKSNGVVKCQSPSLSLGGAGTYSDQRWAAMT